MDKTYYSISEVCNMLQIKPYTIRYWETEFVSLKNKTKKGHTRRYTEKDIEILRQIKHLILDKRFTLEGAKAEMKRMRKADGGELVADSGELTVDSGHLTADSGQPTVDSGQLTADVEQETVDEMSNEEKSITWGELQKKFVSMSETQQKIEQSQFPQDVYPDDEFGDIMVAKPISTKVEVEVEANTIVNEKLDEPKVVSVPQSDKVALIRNELLEIKRILKIRS